MCRQSTFIFRKPSTLGLRVSDRSVAERQGFIKRMEIRCRRTKTRVIKTIRLKMTEMAQILNDLPEEGLVNRNNFNVVYLARDPRGIINSVKNLQEQWPERFLDPQHTCSRLYEDAVFQSNHSDPRMMVVRYEDIAVKPEEELRTISQSLNISFPAETIRFIREHSSVRWDGRNMSAGSRAPTKQIAEENPENEIFQTIAKEKLVHKESETLPEVIKTDIVKLGRVLGLPALQDLVEYKATKQDIEASETGSDYYDSNGKIMTVRRKRSNKPSPKNSKIPEQDPAGRSYYYSTYRRKDFNPDHWRQQLSKDILDEISRDPSCQAAIKAFGYPEE